MRTPTQHKPQSQAVRHNVQVVSFVAWDLGIRCAVGTFDVVAFGRLATTLVGFVVGEAVRDPRASDLGQSSLPELGDLEDLELVLRLRNAGSGGRALHAQMSDAIEGAGTAERGRAETHRL